MNERYLRLRRKTLKENEVLDEMTGHKFVKVNGVLTEYKYCSACKQWYVIEDFAHDRDASDGLGCYCSSCRRKKGEEQRKKCGERKGYVVYFVKAEIISRSCFNFCYVNHMCLNSPFLLTYSSTPNSNLMVKKKACGCV